MLTIALCEDEPRVASKLKAQVFACLDRRNIQAQVQLYSHGEALLQGTPPDVLLMDIKLPGTDGMTVVEHLRAAGHTAPVLFLTAYPQHVFRAFDLDAVHYLLKPIQEDQLAAALDKALARLQTENLPALWLTTRSQRRKILHRDILFCEALDHQVTVHTLTETLPFPGSLDALEASLSDRFFRCHKSYLVNLDQVTALSSGSATVTGGKTVLVSRRRQRSFAQCLLSAFPEGGTS